MCLRQRDHINAQKSGVIKAVRLLVGKLMDGYLKIKMYRNLGVPIWKSLHTYHICRCTLESHRLKFAKEAFNRCKRTTSLRKMQ